MRMIFAVYAKQMTAAGALALALSACSSAQSDRADELPRPASGEWTYNASPTIQDNLVSAEGRQYAIWVGADRNPLIARRALGGREWETFDLSTIPGNPLDAPTAEDGHNFYSMAIDADGYIHISGNHHNDPLNSIRSAQPYEIDSWEVSPMMGADEERVTYPKFLELPDGTLLFTYRNGGAGRGDHFLNRYDRENRTWSRLHTLVSGAADGLSFYPNHISTRDGSIHVMGVWRARGGPHTNRHVTYFRSDDAGETWIHADGSPQAMPVSISNADIAVPTAPEGSGLLNGGGLEVDTEGRPHGALTMYDEDGFTQVFHIWHDGAAWHHRPVTQLTHRTEFGLGNGGFVDNKVGHPSVVTTADGSAFILYRSQEHGEHLRAVDVSAGQAPCEFTAASIEMDYWNATFDTQALYTEDRVDMLVTPTGHPQDPEVAAHLSDWSSVPVTLLSIAGDDLVRMADDCRR